MRQPRRYRQGFTLIELSIVLVIIGLIIGGIMVGQDLISAAATRAQISQIEKYNTAVNTFKVKFGYLPGDIPDPYASEFGFQARGQYAGEGDGNGIIEGIFSNYWGDNGGFYTMGETNMVWVDLTTANMMDGSFTTATPTTFPPGWPPAVVSAYFPPAKIGNGNSISVWSGGLNYNNNINYFGISVIGYFSGGAPFATPGLTVAQAYNIDKKVDDGLPQTGQVTALYLNNGTAWAAGGGAAGASPGSSATGSPTTCFDNGGSASAMMQYSMEISNGANVNCALSFRMQGAAR